MASCSFSHQAIRLFILSSLALAFTSAAVAAPNAPTNLRCAVTGSNAFTLIWDDNSTDETTFDLVYNANGTGSNTFALGASPGTGTISTSLSGISGTATFQIRATNGSGSSLSNVVNATFATLGTPGNLLSKAQADGSMILMWTDNAVSEAGYFVEIGTAAAGPFTLLGSTGPNFTGMISTFAPFTTYYFRVRGFQGTAASPTAYSAYSSVASFTTPDGFISGTAPPIFFNQAFSYQAVVTTGSARTSWSITGLPTGLNFNSSTGAITGTPTVTGAFNCPMSATFANGWTASNTLQLRVIRAPGAPVPATTITTQTLAVGGNTSVALGDKFSDPDSESAVRIVTNIGTMDFILFNSATPQTVTNFLGYVNAAVNNYNGAVFHRAISGFVAQGGAYKVQSAPNNFSVTPTSASPSNEPGISNLRGTVAMAKSPGNPNSATNQFFVNLGNNSSNLDRDSGSPNANGGFTAFARVAGNGMTVADTIGNLPSSTGSVNLGGTTTSSEEWPLTSASAAMDTTKVVSITSAAPVAVLRYAVTGNTSPAVASATISGTNVQINALAGGQTNVTVTATDLDGSTVSQTFSVTVNQAPTITSSPPPAAIVNGAYSVSYTTTGFPAPTFSVTSGELPTGLNLSTGGVISGTPTAAGTFTGTVTASNGIGTAATQNFSITVNQAPAFTNAPPSGSGVVGTAYTSFTYTATGAPAPTFTVTSGALPTGLSLSTGGVISGTPTAAGAFTGTVTASNGIGTAATQNFSITVNQAPAFTNAPPSGSGVVGTTYTSFTYTATGSPAPTFTVTSGALPTGLSLSTGGVISGTPTAAGTFTGTVSASNGIGTAATQNFSITVNQAPAFTNGPPSSAGVVGTTYTSFTYTATGSPAPTFTVTSGALPTGLSLSTGGVISGTPTAAGAFTGTVTASNGIGTAATQNFSITVNQAPAFTNAPPSSAGVLGAAYTSFTYTTTGSPAPTFTVTSGALPTGLSLSTGGVITGTPTVVGTFTGTVTASNGIGTAATQNFSITVNQVPAFTNAPPSGSGVFGTAYTSFTYSATGSPAPTFAVTSGALPTGLSLSTGGVLSGTPTAAGTFTGTVTASNGIGTAATQNFSIVIAKAAAMVSLGGLTQTFNNTPRFATATTTPSGLTVDYLYDSSSTAPTNAGSYAVVATINDSNYSGTASGTLAIAKATAGLVLNGLLQTYDGSPKPVSATTTPSGLTVSITYDGSASAPTNHGSYVIAASINDANYSGTGSGTLAIRGQSAASWRTQRFSSPEITAGLAADDADPDGDGLKNLVEYALGTDPRVRNASPAPILNGNGLTLSFTRPKDLPNVSYSAESTDSFGTWTPITLELVNDGPVQTWRARDTLATGNPNRRFIRLVFTTVAN